MTHIGNKIKRQEVYRKHAKDKAKAKLEKRIKRAEEEKAEGGKEKKKVSTIAMDYGLISQWIEFLEMGINTAVREERKGGMTYLGPGRRHGVP